MSAGGSVPPPLRFLTNDVCPFAARAWIVLEELSVPYEKVNVTLAPGLKEEFFTKTYQSALGANEGSDGKVPVIVEPSGFVLTESAVIAAYLDETHGDRRLSGTSPVDRAVIAIFLDQIGSKVSNLYYPFLRAQTPEAQVAAREQYEKGLAAFDAALGARGGPFVLGDRISLADTNTWPFLLRAQVVLGHYRAWSLDAARFPNVQRFADAMRARASVRATTPADAVLIEGYASYANPGK